MAADPRQDMDDMKIVHNIISVTSAIEVCAKSRPRQGGQRRYVSQEWKSVGDVESVLYFYFLNLMLSFVM